MKRAKLSITGQIELKIFDKEGKLKDEETIKNAIETEFKEALVVYFDDNTKDICLDNLFSAHGTPPAEGEDGIVAYASAVGATDGYSFDMDANTDPTTTSFKVSGHYENETGGAVTITNLSLGHNFEQASDEFETKWANASVSKTLQDGEVLTVDWTISLS